MAYRASTGTTICPLCAGPKTHRAVICRPCFIDEKRAKCAATVEHGVSRGRLRCVCSACVEAYREFYRERRRKRGEIKGTSTGRRQPKDHPWRKR